MNTLVKKAIAATTTVGAGLLSATSTLAAAPGAITQPKGYSTDIGVFVGWVLTVVMVIAILLVLLYLVLGGIEWITSGGDKGKTEGARNKITAAIIGIIILAAAYALASFVAYIFGFDLANIFSNIQQIK